MRIHIVGFGAIGTLTSFYLRNSLDPKHAVVVLHKTAARVSKASRAGGFVKLENAGVSRTVSGFVHQSFDPYDDVRFRHAAMGHIARATDKHLPPPLPQPSATPAEHATPIDSLIVCTKATFVVSVIKDFLPRLSANSTIVLLHNGMGVYESLIRKVFRNPEQRPHIVVTCNTHGAYVRDYGHVIHTGVGDVQLGIMPDPHGRDFEASVRSGVPSFEQQRQLRLDDITPVSGDPLAERYLSLRNTIAALTAAEGLSASWRPFYDVQLAMHRKLVVNSAVNPVTALLGCKNGDLLKYSGGLRIAERICREASNAFRAQWCAERTETRAGDQGEPAALTTLFPPTLLPDQLLAECEHVLKLTQANTSSMLVDVMRQRETEASVLTGYLLALGRKYDVDMPVTATIHDMMLMRSNIPLDRCVPWSNVAS